MTTITSDWPKINYGQPKPRQIASQQETKPVYVQRQQFEIHRTGSDFGNAVVAYATESAYALRICRLLREDEKLHNRKYRDVSHKIWDHATHKYLSY